MAFKSMQVSVLFRLLALASANVIDRNCPGGKLCVENGRNYLFKHNSRSDETALSQSEWCEDNGFHYKVWSEIHSKVEETNRYFAGFLRGSWRGGSGVVETEFMLEHLIPFEWYAKTFDPLRYGQRAVVPWLAERCIPAETYLAHWESMRYSLDSFLDLEERTSYAKKQVEKSANSRCKTTKAKLNCEYAQVQCSHEQSTWFTHMHEGSPTAWDRTLPVILFGLIVLAVFVVFRKSKAQNTARTALVTPTAPQALYHVSHGLTPTAPQALHHGSHDLKVQDASCTPARGIELPRGTCTTAQGYSS